MCIFVGNGLYTGTLMLILLFCSHDGPRVKRRWFVNRNYNGCSVDAGWWTVLDMHHSTPCDWDTYTVLPKFLYSRRSTADKCDSKHLNHKCNQSGYLLTKKILIN